MPRYAALLRGVMPRNASMPALRAAFEAAGFRDVRTVLASGNVVFSARTTTPAALERRIEAALKAGLAHGFPVMIRTIDALQDLLQADPWRAFRIPPRAKRVVTFLRTPPKPPGPALPVELHGARILACRGREAFTTYLPTPKGPVFMSLIERTFGKDVTTRTWDTVGRIVRAGAGEQD